MKSEKQPVVYSRSEHSISRQHFSKNALTVLYGLHKAGYRALLVGGCLRDVLRGESPKDFDVTTDATPEQVKEVFRNCRIIGRRFRLAHVHFGRDIIEVATFRADEKGETDSDGLVVNHNTFGTITTDVHRRDFTLNALYYDIADFSIIDYVGAMEDIDDSVIRMIGDPLERYEEDPVRMLRAARFAAKLGMRIEPKTEQAIARKKHLLENIPTARLFDETIKLFLSGYALAAYEELRIYDLFGELFPATDALLKKFDHPKHAQYKKLIKQALKNTDHRLAHDEPVAIGFLYAVILWPLFTELLQQKINDGIHWHQALHDTIDMVFHEAAKRVGIPMRHKSMVRDIWVMQSRLTAEKLNKKRMESVLMHKRFRAGYDFLELRLQSGEKELQEFYEIWVQAQIDMPEAVRVSDNARGGFKKKRRRRK
ncbi:MAG: polynucleotide adenylyltransferase PcnB [Gammaproteobacteria bacterium]|nr:polynucleotide adenylyltransferase PcnB [Gammaproteobacteria bacterium]